MFDISQYPLKFARDALEPFMSAQSVDYHYGKHLDGYIKNLNELISGTEFEKMPLAEIVQNSDGKIFNNAAQVFNHDFFFSGLRPGAAADVPPQIADAFGGAENLKSQFKAAAMSVFGSGWVWLVDAVSDATAVGGNLKIITTANADTPIKHGQKPLLVLDVWEHAYYLDHQNRRGDFVDAFLNHLADWNWAESNLNS